MLSFLGAAQLRRDAQDCAALPSWIAVACVHYCKPTHTVSHPACCYAAGGGVRAELRRARVQRQRELVQRLAHRPARRARARCRCAAGPRGAALSQFFS